MSPAIVAIAGRDGQQEEVAALFPLAMPIPALVQPGREMACRNMLNLISCSGGD
jgi:hypothetical protein